MLTQNWLLRYIYENYKNNFDREINKIFHFYQYFFFDKFYIYFKESCNETN